MPGVSGLEVARAVCPPCRVIFTTAYDQYAIDAFTGVSTGQPFFDINGDGVVNDDDKIATTIDGETVYLPGGSIDLGGSKVEVDATGSTWTVDGARALKPGAYRVGASVAVGVVYIPQYVLGHWWEQLLHNQSALRLRSRLIFTPGVMVSSVPWQLASSEGAEEKLDRPAAGDVRRGGA